MAVRALVIEDEPLARQTIRDFLKDESWLVLIGEACDGPTAVSLIDQLRPDLIFLDVQIPGLTGLQVLERARHQPAIVFTTAYDKYAVAAFELAAVDYLLKPFRRERFSQALERVRRMLTDQREAGPLPSTSERVMSALREGTAGPMVRLFVRDARGTVVHLHVGDISRLIAADDYVQVHANKTSYLVSLTLNDFERRLDPERFRRVHRSVIVNLDHVVTFEIVDRRLLLKMSDGSEVFASRPGSKQLREMLV